jgi:hypothetical protein
MEVVLGLLAGAASIASIVCLIMVVIKLFQDKGVGWGIFGIFCSIYTFIWGWQNYARFDLKNVMIIWTAAFVTSIIVRVLITTMTASSGVTN